MDKNNVKLLFSGIKSSILSFKNCPTDADFILFEEKVILRLLGKSAATFPSEISGLTSPLILKGELKISAFKSNFALFSNVKTPVRFSPLIFGSTLTPTPLNTIFPFARILSVV